MPPLTGVINDMNDPFGPIYADTYDLIYQDKDYGAECDLIETIFKKFGDGNICNILDLGCGTGGHAIPLAQRGYKVVGIDYSEGMLVRARVKAAEVANQRSVVFQQGDIRNVDQQQIFDAALMMFAVLGYQLENDDVTSALRTACRHLRSGGLLIFDVWYGPAVLHVQPSQRIKVAPFPNGKILRAASGSLEVRRQRCIVHFLVWRFEGDRLVGEIEEDHTMRFFFPLELQLFLENVGLTLLHLGAFPDFNREPDETTWNVVGVARKA